MKKILQILKHPVTVSILYAVVSLYGTWAGVDYLAQEPQEVVPIYRVMPYEEQIKAMQAEIDELIRKHSN